MNVCTFVQFIYKRINGIEGQYDDTLLLCDDQELVTEDMQFEDPLLRVEGWQEIEHLTSAFRCFF